MPAVITVQRLNIGLSMPLAPACPNAQSFVSVGAWQSFDRVVGGGVMQGLLEPTSFSLRSPKLVESPTLKHLTGILAAASMPAFDLRVSPSTAIADAFVLCPSFNDS